METEKIYRKAVVTAVTPLAEGIVSLWLKEPGIAARAKCGQFVSVYSKDNSRLLPRPISICRIDRKNGMIRLVFRIAGEGTKEFAALDPGDTLDLLGPLGNGYTLEDKKAILIGGGIGIPPMLELFKELSCEKTAVLGYRNADTFLLKEFKEAGKVFLSTEDGSLGTKGNVIDCIRENGLSADILYACGPKPMLLGVKAYAEEMGIRAQISLEERMACGVGACLACVFSTTEKDGHSNVKNKRICKDGPVFYLDEL